jgi:hypothetical protein
MPNLFASPKFAKLIKFGKLKTSKKKIQFINITNQKYCFICKHINAFTMNHLKNKALLLFTMIGLGLTLHAAPITPPPPGGGPPGTPIPGIVYALIAAIGYGAYKNYTSSKK